MRKVLRIKRINAASLAISTCLVPLPLVQAATTQDGESPRPSILGDIRLDVQGALRGKMVNGQGHALTDQPLRLLRDGKLLGETRTDSQGDFVFEELQGGVYQVQVDQAMVTCRVWTRNAAPPVAREQLLLVDAPELARGQQPIGQIFTNPLFLGLLVAAAIAIPISIHNSQKDAEPSS